MPWIRAEGMVLILNSYCPLQNTCPVLVFGSDDSTWRTQK